jgi:predicted PurR-regulated permease PerM
LISQGSELVNNVPEILTNLRDQAAASDSHFLRTTGVDALNRLIERYEAARADPGVDSGEVRRYGMSVLSAVFGIFTLFVITFYWTTERARVKRLVLGQVRLERRDRAFDVWDRIEEKLGGWVRGQLMLSAIIGVLSAAGYFLLGLDYWLALAIIAGVTEVIPFLGPILAGTAAVAVALTESPQTAIFTLIFVIALQQLENAVLVPRVLQNAVGLSPLSVILAVLIGGAILGPLGAIVAIPVAAAGQVLVMELLESSDGPGEPAQQPATVAAGPAEPDH